MSEHWIARQTVDLVRGSVDPRRWAGMLLGPTDDRALEWILTVNRAGQPADLEGCVAAGYFLRPDGVAVRVAGEIADNVITIMPGRSCYNVPGELAAQVRLGWADGSSMELAEGLFYVGPDETGEPIQDGDAIPSLEALAAMIQDMEGAAQEARDAAQVALDAAGDVTEADSYAKRSQSWAVGGTGIREDEDSDNAKYYAEEAETSKIVAGSSADDARASAMQANTAYRSAQTYAGNASLSATRAATSETNAKGYADIASAVVETAQKVLDSIPEDYTALQDDVEGKLDRVQDAGYANKIMVIGNDGALVPGEAPVPVAVRSALLDIFQHVAYVDEQGAQKLAALESAMAVRTLSAISAAISQGSTIIYTDDGLDQLRPLMTVTATYSDGTTAVISNYALTGTLAPGECVIGVQYGGMTDTVTVTATQPEVTVVALTADFDPDGATIYTSTPLDDLRQYLTVMALYSNGMSAEASTYTIEGTLREGANTLTVRFKGQYALFSVTAAAPVPVRLEAVYNPPAGYVIYTDDDLDKVAAYLTVTEYYVDGSSVVVTDYTLTGTLVDGTSTLTVEYDELTTTVQVEAVDYNVLPPVPALPSGYTVHDHIWVNKPLDSSTNQNKQISANGRIVTDKLANANVLDYRIVCYDVGNHYGSAPFFGIRAQSGITHYLVISTGRYKDGAQVGTGDNKVFGVYHGVDLINNNNTPVVPTGRWIEISARNDVANQKTILTVDHSDSIEINWTNSNVLNATINFFSGFPDNSTDQYAYVGVGRKIRRLFITDQNRQTVADFVPCVRNSDNAIGFYDAIANKFYTAKTASYAIIGNSNCVYSIDD